METKECAGCDLRYADLSEAKLNNADLSGADLFKAKVSYANLSEAKLCKTRMPDGIIYNRDCKQLTLKKQQVQSKADEVLSGLAAKKKLLATKECVRCVLRKADLSDANLNRDRKSVV